MVCVVDPLFHLYVYGDVPPEPVALAEPFAVPQVEFVVPDFIVKTAGWVMLAVLFDLHPLASLAVIMYVPAAIDEILCVVPPLLHLYV